MTNKFECENENCNNKYTSQKGLDYHQEGRCKAEVEQTYELSIQGEDKSFTATLTKEDARVVIMAMYGVEEE